MVRRLIVQIKRWRIKNCQKSHEELKKPKYTIDDWRVLLSTLKLRETLAKGEVGRIKE